MSDKTSKNATFLNLIVMGGTTTQKLTAAKAAGFDEVEIWTEDVESFDGDASALGRYAKNLELGFTDCMVLRDFAGAPAALRAAKRTAAIDMLERAVALGTDAIQSPATTLADCDPTTVDDDLRWLAAEAATRGIRVCYEPIAWSILDYTLPAAWERIQRIGASNLGIVVDLFHICSRNRPVSDLDGIDVDRIFQVQLCDLAVDVSPSDMPHLIDTARHRRVLPGEGKFPLHPYIQRLQRDGYQGPVGVEVFSDVLKAQDPQAVAHAAMASLKQVWHNAEA